MAHSSFFCLSGKPGDRRDVPQFPDYATNLRLDWGTDPVKLLLLERASSNLSPQRAITEENTPPLPASPLSSLTFCSGRNGGSALDGSKTAHLRTQTSRGCEPKSKAINTLPIIRLLSMLCQKNPAKALIPIDMVGRGYPRPPTSKHPTKSETHKNAVPPTHHKNIYFQANKERTNTWLFRHTQPVTTTTEISPAFRDSGNIC